jgi:uncharacterized protein with FMN-binding domain
LRRAVLTLGGTAAGLAALLTFKTHAAVSDAAVAPTPAPLSASAPPGGSAAGSPLASRAATPPASAPPSKAAAKSPAATPAASKAGAPAAKPATKAPPASTPSATGASPRSGTFTGGNENTQYGPVQVQITVAGSKITGVNELQQPDDSIGANAITQLDAETLAAGSGHIQAVSGATYTSAGYLESLQSAVDQAGL